MTLICVKAENHVAAYSEIILGTAAIRCAQCRHCHVYGEEQFVAQGTKFRVGFGVFIIGISYDYLHERWFRRKASSYL
jgi:hypothetical protein